MKNVIFILMLVSSTIVGNGQYYLNVGDQVPSNLRLGKKTISKYKGKLTVVYFFDILHGSTQHSLSTLDSLEKSYPKEVRVVLLSTQNTEEEKAGNIRKASRQYIKASGYSFHMVTGDIAFSSHFRPRTPPYHILVGPNGKVLAITENSRQITKSNIEIALRYGFFNFPTEILTRLSSGMF
jgi:hypothetical protein